MRAIRWVRRYSTQLRSQADTILKLDPAQARPSALALQRSFLNSLGDSPSKEELDLAFEVYNKVFELTRGVDHVGCARLCLLSLNRGDVGKALESWTRLFETLTTRSSAARVATILDQPEFESATLAALAAYFVAAKDSADAAVAQKLVPRLTLPANLDALAKVGGIKDVEAEARALLGLAKLQEHISKGFTSEKYLQRVSALSKSDIGKFWDQVKLARPESEIPEACFAAYIRRYGELGEVETAFSLWRSMLATKSVKPTVLSWAALLQAAAKVSTANTDFFVALWNRMLSHNIVPDARCHFSRLKCLDVCGQREELLKEFNDLQQMHVSRSTESPPVLDTAGINLAVKTYCSLNKLDEALKVLELAKSHKIALDADSYTPVMMNAGLTPEIEARVVHELEEAKIEPNRNSYIASIRQALRRRQPIGALYLAMERAKLRPSDDYELTDLLWRGFGDYRQAATVVEDFMAAAQENRLRLHNKVIWAVLGYEQRVGNFEGALKHLNTFTRPDSAARLSLSNRLIGESLARNRPEIAFAVFNALTLPENLVARPTTETYLIIFEEASKEGRLKNTILSRFVQDALALLEAQASAIDGALAKVLMRPNILGLLTHDLMQRAQDADVGFTQPRQL